MDTNVSGYFDEAGALAYWGIFALIINRLIGNTKYENPLIAVLFATLSIGYFIQVLLFLCFTKLKSVQSMLLGVFLIGAFMAATYYTKDTAYDNVYQMTWSRMEYDDTKGTIAGNSRQHLAEKAKAKFLEEPVFGVGGIEFHKDYMDDNPYETLGRDGIVGTIAIYLPLLYILFLSFGRRRFDIFGLAIVLVAGFLQRPFHDYTIYYIMLYATCILMYKNIIRPLPKFGVMA